jgi:beta-lactamase class A
MAAVFAAEKEGRIRLTDQLAIERKEKVRSSSKLYRARTGTRFTYTELIEHMITESDNTAANMIVDSLGFGYLNQKFVEFGLKNTDLRRGIMDLKWRKAGIENYTTAEDMALLLEKIYDGQLVSPEASAQMMAVLKRQKVNDRIPKGLPKNIVIAHKTGLLNDTVSDVGVIFTKEGDFIICVLTADIHNFRTAKRFIGKIANCAYDKCYKKPSI